MKKKEDKDDCYFILGLVLMCLMIVVLILSLSSMSANINDVIEDNNILDLAYGRCVFGVANGCYISGVWHDKDNCVDFCTWMYYNRPDYLINITKIINRKVKL